jgi:shikimate dehydrogenase
MHNAAFQEMNINAVYVALHVRNRDLEAAVSGMTALNFAGVNVTLPHKVSIMNYLSRLDETAENVGAVNTLVPGSDGWIGYNTDVIGLRRVLHNANVPVSETSAVVFGTGGASKAVVYALITDGCSDIKIVGRTPSHVTGFARDISIRHDKRITGILNSTEEVASSLRDADLVINATPVGMHPNTAESVVPSKLLRSQMTVLDLVYRPSETKLLKEAVGRGCTTIRGGEMLVEQGAAALRLWLQRNVPKDLMKQALERCLE